MCIRIISKKSGDVRFNYSTYLTIIITQMTMTNQLEEPDSWTVIDNLDLEPGNTNGTTELSVSCSSCIIIFGVLVETRSQCDQEN